MGKPIGEYALIGDCETAALVARDGSIDWMCTPRFDSAACFAALLGTEEHGFWKIAPTVPVRATRRRYRPGTLVLETEFETDAGVAAVIDFMPPRTEVPDLIRVVEGRGGSVPMQSELVMRFEYGSVVPWVRSAPGGIVAVAGPDLLRLVTPARLRGERMRTFASFEIAAGERVPFDLAWGRSHLPAPGAADPLRALADTEAFWRAWSDRSRCEGPHRDAVLRSLITLKALTYAPTGGIVAAPTTSLPEAIGGNRNWDYRHCWLRDSTFTLYALLHAGHSDEARAWSAWLVRAVAGTPAQTQIMYGLAGERRLTEIEIGWLPGYRDSRPVRIGNAASTQMQLDVFGEVLDTLHLVRRLGMDGGDEGGRVERALVDWVARVWSEPDYGIWEVRGPPRHFTYSKVMAWVALDRGVKAVEEFGLPGPVERWRAVRDEIHKAICERGFDPSLGSFVQFFGGRSVDASLLLLPQVGFLSPGDPRLRGTVARIEAELVVDGLVARYLPDERLDGIPHGEGAFLACSFWLVDAYVLLGRHAEARSLFDRLVGLANDVGLLSEQIEYETGAMLGNFPQAFSHIALVNSARNLAGAGGPAEERQKS